MTFKNTYQVAWHTLFGNSMEYTVLYPSPTANTPEIVKVFRLHYCKRMPHSIHFLLFSILVIQLLMAHFNVTYRLKFFFFAFAVSCQPDYQSVYPIRSSEWYTHQECLTLGIMPFWLLVYLWGFLPQPLYTQGRGCLNWGIQKF